MMIKRYSLMANKAGVELYVCQDLRHNRCPYWQVAKVPEKVLCMKYEDVLEQETLVELTRPEAIGHKEFVVCAECLEEILKT